MTESNTKKKGFQSMPKEKQRAIASKGGRAAHAGGNAHRFNSEEAREAGKKGGRSISRDRAHMRRIGTLGGLARKRRKETFYVDPSDKHPDRTDHC